MKKTYILMCLVMIFLVVNIPVAFAKIVAGMEPIRTHKVIIKKRDTGGNLNIPQDLDENEMAILEIRKIDSTIYEKPFEQAIMYNWNSTDVFVDLIPGKYEVEGQLLLNEEVVIPEDVRTFCKGITGGDWKQTGSTLVTLAITQGVAIGGAYLFSEIILSQTLANLFGGMVLGPIGLAVMGIFLVATLVFDCIGSEEELVIDSINMSIVPVGGVSLTNETGVFWNVNGEELDSRNDTIFYVFYMHPPVLLEQFGVIGEYAEFSRRYKNLAIPE